MWAGRTGSFVDPIGAVAGADRSGIVVGFGGRPMIRTGRIRR
jgi:hypothetical protein